MKYAQNGKAQSHLKTGCRKMLNDMERDSVLYFLKEPVTTPWKLFLFFKTNYTFSKGEALRIYIEPLTLDMLGVGNITCLYVLKHVYFYFCNKITQ